MKWPTTNYGRRECFIKIDDIHLITHIYCSDLKIIRNVLGKYATYIYGAESMLYLTASIPDLYEKPDIEMESAIIQVSYQK